jgi:hypothetical protein
VRFVGAELLARPYPQGRSAPPALHLALPRLYSLQLEGPRFRVYRLSLPPGSALEPHAWPFSGALCLAKPTSLLSFGGQRGGAGGHQGEGGGGGSGAAGAPGGAGAAAHGGLLAGLGLADAAWFDGPAQIGAAVNSSKDEEFFLFVVEWL